MNYNGRRRGFGQAEERSSMEEDRNIHLSAKNDQGRVTAQMSDRQGQAVSEGLEEIGIAILQAARSELYMGMRFLDVALASFYYQMDGSTASFGTDGLVMYYNPQYLGGLYRNDRVLVNRAYLHMVLHCIFRHMTRRGERDELLWNLSCDIAVEFIIDGNFHRSVRRSRSFLRRETYRKLKEKRKVLNAESIYQEIMAWDMPQKEILRLYAEYLVDDHMYWDSEDDPKKNNEVNQKWQDISEQMETDMETFSREASEQAGDLLDELKVENRERFDYRQFLKKFAVLKEEPQVDPDSFDYTFYSYGLRLYGNMPLIEPLESKEVKKVEEFAIVIDTSMSCKGELVKEFLEETYSVLSESGSFFKKVNIHIIQCDDQVQGDKKITCEEELKEYMEKLELRGEGGTDFRPAFEYVEELRRRKEFGNLKGLIYFTDGYGIYPKKMPPYETAFVFLKDEYEDVEVPPWAMKLILEEEDINGHQESKTGN